MPPQKLVEPRRSRRLSEQKQRIHIDKESSHPHVWISSIMGSSAKQEGGTVQVFNQDGNKASVARSPNAFILFRSDFWAREKLKVEPIERDHRDISRIAAVCWNNLDEETKAVYRKRAEEHRALHCLQHPEYKCTTLQGSARKGRRRTRQSGSIDEERCKRLAVQVMAEFQKGRKTRKRRIRDGDHGPFSDPSENMKESEEIEERHASVVVRERSPMPTFCDERKETRMNIESMIANAVDTQFGYRPRLEQYIPELQFCQNNSGPTLRTDGWDKTSGHSSLSTREGVVDPDCEVELDQYFQFDKCEED
ncbi:hypothetical protein APHAL10511_006171 [Amanita phalloides]|nr:hypothetical protein APHAL10511_006171 [Amanita phalloides]